MGEGPDSKEKHILTFTLAQLESVCPPLPPFFPSITPSLSPSHISFLSFSLVSPPCMYPYVHVFLMHSYLHAP